MASKSKRRRKVLGASCILAALIIAGSSFAWFTSKDEVTNRLTATADYGVTIAEDFTPPENWVPGQTIEKNVGVVNTGNIDAFVRTWLQGEMDILAEKRDTTTWDTTNSQFKDKDGSTVVLKLADTYTKDGSDSDNDSAGSLTKTTDDKLNAIGLTYSYNDSTTPTANKVYLKELGTEIYANPNDPTTAGSNPDDGYNEVMTVQAGGVLAYLKTNTAAGATYFYYKPNVSNTFKSSKGATYEVDGNEQYTVKLDTSTTSMAVSGDDITVDAASNVIYVKDEDAIIKYLGNHIDSDNFYPATTGLFIFRRNSDKSTAQTDPTISDYEFSGYYYVKSTTEDGIKAESGTVGTDYKTSAENTFALQGKYFALQYENDSSQRSDYVLEKDTYTITRDDDGNVSFYPYRTPGTYGGSDAVQVGNDAFDATTGYKLTGNTFSASGTAKSVTLFTAEEKVLENNDLTWNYYEKAYVYNGASYYTDSTDWYPSGSSTKLDTGNTDENAIITALNSATSNRSANLSPMYVVTPTTPSTTGQAVKIDITLANVGTATDAATAETWTPMTSAGAVSAASSTDAITFYYNNDVEEGATTSKLVDSVTMDSTVTQYDYIAFDFDLNVFSDSVQVTLDNTGAEQTTSVNPWAANNGNGNTAIAAKGTKGNTATDTEITYITWAKNA